MLKQNLINAAYERLVATHRDYEAAHARTVALESELLAAQLEVARLQPPEPGVEAIQPPSSSARVPCAAGP